MGRSTYIAAKLFSANDRTLTFQMGKALLDLDEFFPADIYIPYRDSNEIVSATGNVARNIFKADIEQLLRTELLIARLDGMSYDSGVGIEVGICLARGVNILLFSMDYYATSVAEQQFSYSPLVSQMVHCPYFEYKRTKNNYEMSLQENRDQFLEFLKKCVAHNKYKNPKTVRLTLCDDELDRKYDVFGGFWHDGG